MANNSALEPTVVDLAHEIRCLIIDSMKMFIELSGNKEPETIYLTPGLEAAVRIDFKTNCGSFYDEQEPLASYLGKKVVLNSSDFRLE